jgi:hypothetical protein
MFLVSQYFLRKIRRLLHSFKNFENLTYERSLAGWEVTWCGKKRIKPGNEEA